MDEKLQTAAREVIDVFKGWIYDYTDPHLSREADRLLLYIPEGKKREVARNNHRYVNLIYQIRSFIDHLNNPRRDSVAEEKPEADRWVTAYVVNDVHTARLFLQHYNIEYKEEKTEDGTKIQVKAPRAIDQERAHDLNQRLRRAHLYRMCDHEFVWRDKDNNTLVTYSPYDVEEVKQTWIEKVEDNFYGHGTTTFIIQC